MKKMGSYFVVTEQIEHEDVIRSEQKRENDK